MATNQEDIQQKMEQEMQHWMTLFGQTMLKVSETHILSQDTSVEYPENGKYVHRIKRTMIYDNAVVWYELMRISDGMQLFTYFEKSKNIHCSTSILNAEFINEFIDDINKGEFNVVIGHVKNVAQNNVKTIDTLELYRSAFLEV